MSELVLFPDIYKKEINDDSPIEIGAENVRRVAELINMREALSAKADEISDEIDEELRKLGLVESDVAVVNDDFDAALVEADVPEFEVNLVRKES